MNAKRSKKLPPAALKLHPTQEAYMVASIAAETLRESIEKTIAETPELQHLPTETDEQWDAREELREEFREAAGHYRVRQELRNAEKALVEWAVEEAKKHSPTHAADLEEMKARAWRRPAKWEELVAICFRYHHAA